VPMILVLAALFGLVIGSFLNVCIYRLPRDQSIVWPASRCTTCGRGLAWYENVPVLSWAVLRGRCRTCGERISVMYPVVEAVTALLFVLMAAHFGITPLFAVRALFGCAMIVLFVVDLQHQILPNEITVPGIVAGLVAACFLEPGWRDALIGAAAGGGSLWLIAAGYQWLRGKEGLGFGDVKMLAMIGAFLGWKLMLLTLVFASFTGSVVAVLLMLARRADWQSKLPLGTFLALGAVLTSMVGDVVVNWYLGFY
jgi:leader peptidase (prepilin peptidase) / N-methyltransferase